MEDMQSCRNPAGFCLNHFQYNIGIGVQMSERHSQGIHQDTHHWAMENERVQRLGLQEHRAARRDLGTAVSTAVIPLQCTAKRATLKNKSPKRSNSLCQLAKRVSGDGGQTLSVCLAGSWHLQQTEMGPHHGGEAPRWDNLQSTIPASLTQSQPLGNKQRPGAEEESTCVTLQPLELQLGADDILTRSMNPDIAVLKINVASEGLLCWYLE